MDKCKSRIIYILAFLCKIAEDYLCILSNAVSIGMRNNLLPSGFAVNNVERIKHENVFSLVVIRDDLSIHLERLYQRTAELLNIDTCSSEYDWLCRHVGISAIYQVEKYCFTQSDIISAVKANNKTGRINDFWLTTSLNKNKIKNKDVIKFKHDLADKCNDLAKEINELGLF